MPTIAESIRVKEKLTRNAHYARISPKLEAWGEELDAILEGLGYMGIEYSQIPTTLDGIQDEVERARELVAHIDAAWAGMDEADDEDWRNDR